MMAIGLVLLVLALIVATGVVLANDQPVSAEAFGVSLDNISVGSLFLLGAAVGALALLGLGLMLAGAARSRARKKAIQEQAENSRLHHESLAEQNARLKAELEASRAGGSHDGPDTVSRPEPATSQRTDHEARQVTPARRDREGTTWSPTPAATSTEAPSGSGSIAQTGPDERDKPDAT